MKKVICIVLSMLSVALYASSSTLMPARQVTIVGGGIIGALEAYYAFQDAQKQGLRIAITVYEKGDSLTQPTADKLSTNTSYNIVPSLTTDEILSVVPRGSQLVEKLNILFSQPGGIRVDDVPGVNESKSAVLFKEAVGIYGSDPNHDDRTLTLLMLGRRSMDLWQRMYDEGDEELKAILEQSNFNPCREPRNITKNTLHDGYRVDLIYGIPDAEKRALGMKADYEKLGYQHCAILTPDEVSSIDPFLTDFCQTHSDLDANMHRIWKNDSVALWRPGGCIDMRSFLPKFYAYLKKVMGQYQTPKGQIADCFCLKCGVEVIGIELDLASNDLRIRGLKFSDGTQYIEKRETCESSYVFCPGEAVGTLQKFGFHEPAYAAFAGASLFIDIPLSANQIDLYRHFSHCMEVHNEGIVLAWQARFKEDGIFIGVAGTKAFYGTSNPKKRKNLLKTEISSSLT